jgi:hypothetical protein
VQGVLTEKVSSFSDKSYFLVVTTILCSNYALMRNADLLECEMVSLNSGCPYCQSNIDSWYGLGLSIYDCMSKETIDGKIQQSDLCKDKCKQLSF